MKQLKASKIFEIRFSEVDSMQFVWHGNYALYFEDAREMFGKKYGLGYMDIFNHGYYAPLVDLNFHYAKPIRYGMTLRVDIVYRYTAAAKLIFDYEIHDNATDELMTTGSSTQVFLDSNYQLMLYNPPFFEEWKKKWLE